MQLTDTYYRKQSYLAKVDQNDAIIGQVERWDAHKKGLLHRGFTTVLTYRGQILMQHRKHPAFDKYWDLSFSSHQIYEDNVLQSDAKAIINTLQREWNLNESDLESAPQFLGKVYYQAKDPKSIFIEHEHDYIYLAALKRLPLSNSDFSYGFKIIGQISEVTQTKDALAPWVETILKEIDFNKIK